MVCLGVFEIIRITDYDYNYGFVINEVSAELKNEWIKMGGYDFYIMQPSESAPLLDAYEITLRGKHCVVVGRSSIVGKPLALMMLNRDATVTTIHSHTIGMADFCRQADILVVAVGKPNLITADMIKPGCVLVDVGINRLDGKLCGDVDYESCFEKASYITPVPGGVGPMTVAMLMANGLKAWECR